MLKFLIGSCGRDNKTLAVSNAETTDNTAASNRGVDNGNYAIKLGFEDTIKVFVTAAGDKAISIGEFSEDTNLVIVFKLNICALKKRIKS